MKYKFYVIDNGNPSQKIFPMEIAIQIIDNLTDDNTEELRQVFQEFYADGYDVKVLTEEEFKKIGGIL